MQKKIPHRMVRAPWRAHARAAARGRFCGQRIFAILRLQKVENSSFLKIFGGYLDGRNSKSNVSLTSYFDFMHFGAIFRFLAKFEISTFFGKNVIFEHFSQKCKKKVTGVTFFRKKIKKIDFA